MSRSSRSTRAGTTWVPGTPRPACANSTHRAVSRGSRSSSTAPAAPSSAARGRWRWSTCPDVVVVDTEDALLVVSRDANREGPRGGRGTATPRTGGSSVTAGLPAWVDRRRWTSWKPEDFLLLGAVLLLPWAFGGVEIWAYRSASLLLVAAAAVALLRRRLVGAGPGSHGPMAACPRPCSGSGRSCRSPPCPPRSSSD